MSNDFNSSTIGKLRRGTPNDPYKSFNETLPIIRGKATLTEIPNRFEKVKVSENSITMYEIIDGEIADNQYRVDYEEGVVFFNDANYNKSLNFQYLGEGRHFLAANGVWVTQDETGDIQTVAEKFDRVDGDIASQKARVDQQIVSVPQPNEILDIRVDRNGTVFPVAKDRIDAEQKKIEDATHAKNGTNYPSIKARFDEIDDNVEDINADISVLNARKISTSNGLLGGGDLTTDRTLSVDFGGNGISQKASRSDHTHAITGLSDVNITSLTDKELLAFDIVSNKWINRTVSETGLETVAGSQAKVEAVMPIQDSNANGRYVKFPDGTLICWYDVTRTDIGCNSAYGSLFQGTFQWIFPFTFVVSPVVTIGLCKWGTGSSWGSVNDVTTTDTLLRIIDVASRLSGTNTYIKAMAVGRWK